MTQLLWRFRVEVCYGGALVLAALWTKSWAILFFTAGVSLIVALVWYARLIAWRSMWFIYRQRLRLVQRGILRTRPYSVFTTAHDRVISAVDLPDLTDTEQRAADALMTEVVAAETGADVARLRAAVTGRTPMSVLLLLDNSGSMRGQATAMTISATMIVSKCLEDAGHTVEIVGFTTVRWRGGLSREDWLRAWRPFMPGRLNDTLLIVYKTASTSMNDAKEPILRMLNEDVLKENIDGEALEWAHRRCLEQSEKRSLIVMVSDGAPVDDSTLGANPPNILELHLRQVIDEIENRSPVELIAIGIGHDVTRYYKRAVTITDPSELAGAMTDKLVELFGETSGPGASRMPAPKKAAGTKRA
jgi:cobaltochelatase CobT